MNACNYQLMTLGNHEFDHGPDQIDSYEKKANFPLISANVLLKETGERRFEAHKVFDLDCGIKVGVFGLTTPSTVTVTSPKSIAPYSFLDHEDLYACAREQVAELKDEGADIIVCMGHLGNQKTNRAARSSRTWRASTSSSTATTTSWSRKRSARPFWSRPAATWQTSARS